MDNEQLLDKVQNLLLGMERVNTRFDGVENRLERVENRLQSVETKVDSISRELTLNNQLLSPFHPLESPGRR